MFDLEFDSEQQQLIETAKKFARDVMVPVAGKLDEHSTFPDDICRQAHELGLVNCEIPDGYGGLGLSCLSHCLVLEELSYGCLGIGSRGRAPARQDRARGRARRRRRAGRRAPARRLRGGARVSAPPSFWKVAGAVLAKDLRVEWRSREILYTTVFFAVVVVLVFSFSFVKEGRAPVDVAAGILWVAVALSGTLGLGRAFEREREGDTLRALLLAPASRAAIFAGKAAGIALLVVATELCVTPLVALFFHAPFFDHGASLAGLLGLGALGYATVGSLFAAALGRARSRDVLLAVIVYPIIVPVIIAGVRGTAALCEQPTADLAAAGFWLRFLLVYDAIFVTLALWVFEPAALE